VREIRSLAEEDEGRIFEAFMAAFADYSVPVAWSRADFDEANARRGFDRSISLGAYEGGRIVGFVLNGSGTWGGEKAAYDLGTGVLPEARGGGLSGAIAAELVRFLPGLGFGRYVLEVIRDNLPALKTYEKAGFAVTRELECPEGSYADPGIPSPSGLDFVDLPLGHAFPRSTLSSFRDWEPTWQNSDDSVVRMPGSLVALGARLDGRLAGHAIASPKGTIWQLAVARGERGRGIGAALLHELSLRVGPVLRYINVQADDKATLGLLARCGISDGVGQFEMTRALQG